MQRTSTRIERQQFRLLNAPLAFIKIWAPLFIADSVAVWIRAQCSTKENRILSNGKNGIAEFSVLRGPTSQFLEVPLTLQDRPDKGLPSLGVIAASGTAGKARGRVEHLS